MGDQSPQNTMNLDLNLGPFVHPSDDDQPDAMTFEDWLLGSMREVISNRPIAARQRLQSVWRHMPVSMEPTNTTLGLTAGDHEGHNEHPSETNKTNNNGDKLETENMGDKNHETNNKNEASFFDCNICLDLASDPVVTCCGHLFCWPCLYRWLFIHSDSKECPLCKGQVTMKTITPIYTTRGTTRPHPQTLDHSNLKIPSRPQANRVESWRQSIQRNTLNIPMFEMIRRLDNRFDLSTNPNQSLLNRIFTSRGLRSGQDLVNVAPDVTVDPPQLMEDRHSVSSIAAVIQSETDSRVSVSTSSRRRCESSTSRVEDVNSGESRSRRRRLQ